MQWAEKKAERKRYLSRTVAVGILLVLVLAGLAVVSQPYIGGGERYQGYALVELKSPNTLNALKNSGLNVVQVYDHYALVKYTNQELRALKSKGVNINPIDYWVGFQTGKFHGNLAEIPTDYYTETTNFYVVQFIGPPTPEWKSGLELNGAKIYNYYNEYAYLVKVDPARVSEIQSLWYVKAVYPFQPYWKLGETIIDAMEKGLTRTRITVVVDPDVDVREVAERIALKYGGDNIKVIQPFGPGTYPAKFEMDVETKYIKDIAFEPEVLAIHNRTKLKLMNSVAARIVGAAVLRDQWRNGLGLPITGAGQVVSIADTGLDTGNPATVIPDFAGRVLTIYDAAGDGDPSDPDNGDLGGHGTHVAGSVAASGVMSGADTTNKIYGNSLAGMAPEAQIHFESIGTVSIFGGGLNYDSITNMATRSYNDGARVWTNSWGSSGNSYDADADEIDTFMWNNKDFLILFAAGNSGPGAGTIGPEANAKSILTVGASENLRPQVNSQGTWSAYSMADNPDQLAYFSSRGYAGDGRTKPDIVAPGSGIVSTRASTVSDANIGATWFVPIDYNGDGLADYIAMQGTSMATPVTAGACVLVRDYYTDVEGLTNPSAALIKATVIGGADPMPGYKYGGPDVGWGRLNIAKGLIPEPPLSMKYWDWQSADTSATWSNTINVVTDEAPLRITLVWTDANGGANANPAIVNNLDLRVIAPDGTEYHGNIFVGNSQWSVANPTAYDSLNTTEVVNVEKPMVGTWTIEVIAANIGLDDPDGPGANDQTFALHVLGPLGPKSTVSNHVKVERYNENMPLGSDYKDFTHQPIQKVIVAGTSFNTTFRVVNWGSAADSYTITSEVIPATTDITVSFSTTSVSLNPGEVAWVNASISAAATTAEGLYEVRLKAVSTTNTAVMDSITINLQVVPTAPVWHNQVTRTDIMETTSAIAVDPTDGSLWVAFFRQNASTDRNPVTTLPTNGDNFDLIVAHSTDGGKTWTEYVALPGFDRYFDYLGSLEQIMDWFYWYPSIDVDSNGKVYVSFGTGESIYVVYGDETGWSFTTFESGSIYSQGFTTYYLIAYPWTKVYCDSRGNTWVFYTWLDTRSGIRDLREVHTSDGGATWNGPNSIDSTGNSDDRRYYPGVAEFNNQLWVFVSQRLGGSGTDTDYYIAYVTYDYSTGTWGTFNTLFGTGSDGFYEMQPTAYADSSGRLWVGWYSDDDQQNANFGVVEHKAYLIYTTDGTTWSTPIKIDANVPGLNVYDGLPGPGIAEDANGYIWVAFAEENSYYTSAPYNDYWAHYRYSIKMAQIDPATDSIVGYKYVDFAGTPIYHVSIDNSTDGTVYISYTKSPEKWNTEIFVAKYGPTVADNLGPATTDTLVRPPNTNNASKIIYIDLVYTKMLTLTALISDLESGYSNIAAAEYFIDTIGADGTGTPLFAQDGAFDSVTEVVNATIDPFSLSRGYHRIYVHGQDANGNWGAFDYIDIYIYASQFRVYGWVNDSAGTPLANVAVNITNLATGENITVYTDANGYYEYYIDQFPSVYSIGDTIQVYADDGTNAGAVDGTYYDVNSTSVSTAPGSAKLNLVLNNVVPEFSGVVPLLAAIGLLVLLTRRRRR